MKVIISQTNSFLTKDKTLADSIYNIVHEMCATHSEHEFIWLSFGNSIPLVHAPFFKNIILKPPVFQRWRKYAWFNNELVSFIKKEVAACVMSFNGRSATTGIPQCVVVAELNGELITKPAPGAYIITFSEHLRQMLIKKGYNAQNVYVVKPPVEEHFRPAEWEEREDTKARYTRGAEYFFFPTKNVSEKQILNVLKAFSLFRKWQRSSAQLLIYGENTNQELKKLLATYKFREDVKICEAAGEIDRSLLTASAISVLYFPETDDTGLAVIESLVAEVPTITCEKGAVPEVGGEAVMYCNPGDVEEIADKMKRIYRDEKYRNQLVSRIVEKASFYKAYKPAIEWWQIVEKAISGR